VTIVTPSLADRTYLTTGGGSALVIDPQRDIDRVLEAAAARGCDRASIAASLLQAAGHTITAVDDDFARAASAGLTIAGTPNRPAGQQTASIRGVNAACPLRAAG